ncbi:MAG TPA: hypothetical protein VNV18_18965 [Stellaceae bacterium]|nr:hypothetical protein [Stellaceae bacterium]
MPSSDPSPISTLADALVALADRQLWRRYCRVAAALERGAEADAAPVYAPGSVEWQRQQDHGPDPERREPPFTAALDAAGRRRLSQRGAALPFAGAPSPLGAAGGVEFDAFVASRRGPPGLFSEIAAVEQQLVEAFEQSGRARRYRASGFCAGARKEIEPDWFGRVRLDFARNAAMLPDRSEIAGVEVAIAAAPAQSGRGRERPARAMLRDALLALWQRGAFTAGTGNERVLALALRELGLSAADPPYGFKSAETVRKLRKALKMSL